MISHLLPISVIASNESSTVEEVATPVVISREGKRKQRVSAAASMIQHNVRRRKKTASQVDYLRTLFHKLGGKWNGQVRREAMQKTGLSRIQIYKWFFDMQLQQKPKEKKVSLEERVSYPPSIIHTNSSDESQYGSTPQPIFWIEKIVRC